MQDDDIAPVGDDLVTLASRAPAAPDRPGFTSAEIIPESGMLLLQVSATLPGRGSVDLLVSPAVREARAELTSDTGDFRGNKSFSMGAAFLLPYANRIRGELSPDGRTITTQVAGRTVRLPANWGGQRAGAERYAMHGLALALPVAEPRRHATDACDRLSGTLDAGDFGAHWLSATRVLYEITLCSDALTIAITAQNVGSDVLPIGIGWHPYFALPSGRREQVRIHVAAAERVAVNNYDDVLPTGEIVPVAGTRYDFSAPGGAALDDLYLDDCFVGLSKDRDGHVVCEIIDPEASYGIRIIATSPHVKAVQIYAPPDKSFVALEPQFNLADPFGKQWPKGVDTGMVLLPPGEAVNYSVRLELFTP